MHFIAAAPWRWQQERVSLGDAPRGDQTPAGAPRSQQHRQRRLVLPLSPAPIHVSGQLVPTSVPIWEAGEAKAGHGAGSPLSLGTGSSGLRAIAQPGKGTGSDGVKIKIICAVWAKVVYGSKQLPEL